ncbi:MAG: AAA family ATPase [Thiotrichaceae bacterium]
MSKMPYIGLRPFREDEADIFFGRDDHANELLDKIGQQYFTAVIGLSGCGKSSLIRAGVIPRMQMGFLPRAGVHWRIIAMCPGTEPFAHLAESLLDDRDDRGIKKEYAVLFEHSDFKPDEVEAFLEGSLRNSLNLQKTLDELKIPSETNFLLIIDQFEEIFGEHTRREEAIDFVGFLLESSKAQSRVYVVITMRAEHIGECARFYDLAEQINRGLFLVPRLTSEQLREAIENPIKVYGGSIENGLVEKILTEADNEPDQLSLIQHLLMGMWNKTRYHDFTKVNENDEPSKYNVHVDDTWYREWVGLKISFPRHLISVYEKLDAKLHLIADYLFRNLVEVSENPQYARQRTVTVADVVLALLSWKRVTNYLSDANITESHVFELLKRVIEEFLDEKRCFLKLSVENGKELRRESRISIPHESIIRLWDTLLDWMRKEQKSSVIYRSLEEAVTHWEHNGKQDGYLLTGSTLALAVEWRKKEQPTLIWAKRYSSNINLFPRVLNLIALSEDLSEKQEREEHQRLIQEKELAQQAEALALKNFHLAKKQLLERKRANYALTVTVIISVAAAIICSVFWIRINFLYTDLSDTQQRRFLDSFNFNIAKASFWIEKVQLDAANTALADNGELLVDTGKLTTVPLSRQHVNKLLQQYTKLFGKTPLNTFPDFESEIYSAIPVGNGLVLGGKAGKWGYFEQDHKFKHYPKLAGDVSAIAHYEPSRWLITGDSSGQVTVWDQNLQKLPEQTPKVDREITALAITDNHLMAGDSIGRLHHWQITPQGLQNYRVEQIHDSRISRGGLTLNSDKTQLLTAAYEPNVKLWGLNDGAYQFKLGLGLGEALKVYQAIFSNNGKALATAQANTGARVFDLSGKPLQSFFGHRQAVFTVQFADQDRHLITGSQDNQIRIWDIESGKTLQVLEGHDGTVTNLLLKDNQLWSTGLDGTVKQWSLDLPYKIVETCIEEKTCLNDFDVTLLANLNHRKHPISLSIAPQGHYVVVDF